MSSDEFPHSVYHHHLTVPDSVLDRNGHVNNVAYVQWMQDVAILHFESLGGAEVMQAAGATWVARSHHIEYLKPAFAGETITIHTWVANFRRVRSLRRYRFLRPSDNAVLAEGETDWVFVDTVTGRPRSIPASILQLLPILDGDTA
ncbi:MAG: acyl-CoA thioesterase [Verrucomicrobiales bacterium]|nr:acyl-CoA thioesterase [Verrucomicrobiales bacterium]